MDEDQKEMADHLINGSIAIQQVAVKLMRSTFDENVLAFAFEVFKSAKKIEEEAHKFFNPLT